MLREISAVAAMATFALAACGNDQGLSSATSPDYFYERVQEVRGSHVSYLSPEAKALRSALPNAVHTAPDGGEFRYSDLLIRGRIENVEKGEARRHTGEDAYELVDFDDPGADERTLDVTIEVLEAYGPGGRTDIGERTTFRVGLLGANEHERYLDSVKSLGEIVLLLDTVEDGRDRGTYYPIMQGAALGQVESSGALAFPGLGPSAGEFMGELDTMEELRDAAQG